MHPFTHLLSGWALATSTRLEPRDRALVTAAAVAPDLDAAGIVPELLTRSWADPMTWHTEWHHVLCHGLPFAVLCAAAAFAVGRRRARTAALVFAAVHVHILCDLVGARGPDGWQWPIAYLWPFSRVELTWSGQWTANAWPNIVFTIALLAWALWYAWREGVSPVGLFHGRADAALVDTLRARFGEVRR